jgi:hypothetical protein
VIFFELSWVILSQRVKLTVEGEAPTVPNTINNFDDNVGISPDSSPEILRGQPFLNRRHESPALN